jgi:ABC-type nickel/cobalt efflux system permease component RcnA
MLGLVFGALFGIIANIWTAYFLKLIDVESKSSGQIALPFVISSLILIAYFAVFVVWAFKLIKGTAR